MGLMGQYGPMGKMVARNGVTVVEDPNVFGQEWQVRDTEQTLFLSAREPQYPKQCELPDPSLTGRKLGQGDVSESQAAAACAKWTDKTVREHCMFDVLATGDLDMADAGTF